MTYLRQSDRNHRLYTYSEEILRNTTNNSINYKQTIAHELSNLNLKLK